MCRAAGDELTPDELSTIRDIIAKTAPREQGVLAANLAELEADLSDRMVKAGFDKEVLGKAREAYRKWATLAERDVVDLDGNVSAAKLERAIRLSKGTKRKAMKGHAQRRGYGITQDC